MQRCKYQPKEQIPAHPVGKKIGYALHLRGKLPEFVLIPKLILTKGQISLTNGFVTAARHFQGFVSWKETLVRILIGAFDDGATFMDNADHGYPKYIFVGLSSGDAFSAGCRHLGR
jgi:hypothetical protein